MQIDIHPEKKLVCIWLTKAESADASAQEQLRPLYDRFRKQKFLVAVFRSGGHSATTESSLRNARSELVKNLHDKRRCRGGSVFFLLLFSESCDTILSKISRKAGDVN